MAKIDHFPSRDHGVELCGGDKIVPPQSLVRDIGQRAAAPEGGAQKWVRGCALFSVMTLASVAHSLDASLHEVLCCADQTLRLRFVAPQIAGLQFEDIEAILVDLCERHAVPMIDAQGLGVEQIAIMLLDRPFDFGTFDPAATQFIDIFSRAGDRCIWQLY